MSGLLVYAVPQGQPLRGWRWTVLASVLTLMAAVAPLTRQATTTVIETSGEALPALVGIVRSDPGTDGSAARAAVTRVGGTVVRPLGIIDGFVAEIPRARLGEVRTAPGVESVTPDSAVRLLGDEWKSDKDLGSFYMVTKSTGAHDAWSKSDQFGRKITGRGIGVALIDSGVVPVKGLASPGKVVNGPDLSFESQELAVRHLDTYGHGTHMAGVIAGRDPEVKAGNENDSKYFVGLAPDAKVINIKVAAEDGATDVSQVIAAIDWVVQHRNDPGLNIKVLNLSFGTDSSQSYLLDPLAYAAEAAWHKGIVVVVAVGNDGETGGGLNNPAIDPYVIAVGAADHRGTEKRGDDVVATFSSRGSLQRRPDLVAPGRSIVSLRNPGSFIDEQYPEGRVAQESAVRYFRGSGSSQATAVVSGAAALLLQQRPSLTPDQVKALLTRSADRLQGSDSLAQGAGLLDVKGAFETSTPTTRQLHPRATGLGSLELARGSGHVVDPVDGTELAGEQDILGNAWTPQTWAITSAAGAAWEGGLWNGQRWSGDNWNGLSWTGQTWEAAEWTGQRWSGQRWSGLVWDGQRWSGQRWSGQRWSGLVWDGQRWSGQRWSGQRWSNIF